MKPVVLITATLLLAVGCSKQSAAPVSQGAQAGNQMTSADLRESRIAHLVEQAENGDESSRAIATYSLGIEYRYATDGSQSDYEEAMKWFSTAASLGYNSAMTELGKMYMEGLGVPLNWKMGAEWLTKAAEMGDSEAQHFLAEAYQEGHGVPKSLVQAYKWFNIACCYSGLDPIAKIRRDLLEERMTVAQVANAQKLSAEWKPTKGR